MALTFGTAVGPASYSGSAAHQLEQIPLTLDDSYPTGGYEITSDDLGYGADASFRILEGTVSDSVTPTLLKYIWDVDNSKLKLIVVSTNAEVANATDLSAYDAINAEVLRY
jgi:hypothetical protein